MDEDGVGAAPFVADLEDRQLHDFSTNVGDIPEVFEDGNGFSQEDVMAAFYSTSPQEDEDSITAYKARAERIVKLSSLEKIYTRKDKAAALTLLSEKRRLVIDESYLLDSWSQVWPVLLEMCVCHTSTLLSGRRLIPS